MGTLWSLSNTIAFTNAGHIAPGAKAYFYQAGTTTPKPVYADAGENEIHTLPVEADGNGRWPPVFLPFGDPYKYAMTTAGGSDIGSMVDHIPNEAPVVDDGGGGGGTTPPAGSLLQTGDIWFSVCDTTRVGAVRCNGKTIGNAASSATERAADDTSDLFSFIWNNWLEAQVTTGRGPNAASDFSSGKQITLPNLASAMPVGLSTMGGVNNGGLDLAPIWEENPTGSPIKPGSTLGSNVHKLIIPELPAHVHAVSLTSGPENQGHTHDAGSLAIVDGGGAHTHTGTTGLESAGHTHTYDKTTLGPGVQVASGSNVSATTTATATSGVSANHTHDFSIASSGTHDHTVEGKTGGLSTPPGGTIADALHVHVVTGNTSSVGTDTYHNNLPRTVTGTWYIRL